MYHRMYNFLWILGEPKKNERVLSNYGLKTEGTSVRGVKVHGRRMNATPPSIAWLPPCFSDVRPFPSLSRSISLSLSLSLYTSLSPLSPFLSHSELSLYVSLPSVSLIPSLTLSLYVSLSLSPSSLSLSLSLSHSRSMSLAPSLHPLALWNITVGQKSPH